MKRFLVLLLICALLTPVSALAAESVVLQPDVPPVIFNGTTLIPLKTLTDWMGLPIMYNEKKQIVSVGTINLYDYPKESLTIAAYPLELTIGQMTATVCGKTVSLEIPAIVWNGRTMVPLRFFAEVFGYQVAWNAQTNIITFNGDGKTAMLYVPPQSNDTAASLHAIIQPILNKYQFISSAKNGPAYTDLNKGPWRYLGQPAGYYGKVLQAVEDPDGSSLFLIRVGDDYAKILAVFSSDPVDIQENDGVTIYGTVLDPYSYNTNVGTINTVPALSLVYYSREGRTLSEMLNY